MFAGPLTQCAQCGAVIESDPVGLGDEVFCCLGCVGGGPCICERADQALITLRIGPFAAQPELLRFAARLEQAPGLVHVELIRPDLNEAAFNIVAPSTQVVVLAVEATPDLAVTAEAIGATVIARISQRGRARADDEGDLLPARTRFRVFRSAESASAEPAPPREPEGPAPRRRAPRPEDEVADLLAKTRPSVSRVRLPDPPPAYVLAPARRRAAAATPPAAVPPSAVPPVRETRDPHEATPPAEAPVPAAPGSLLVVGGPFSSFAAINDFQGIVRALRGVSDTRVRRFYKGRLHLLVEYADEVPFAERLLAVTGGACTATTLPDGQVDVRVCEPDAFSTPHR